MILDWRSFSRRPEIKNLPMNEQLRKFNEETRRLTELNWFIDTQIAIGGSKPGAAAPGFTGQVIDGPISAALVTAKDPFGVTLGTATTNALGVFTFADALPVGTTFTATGGTDSITGVAYTGNMHAEISTDIGIGKSVTISPITTFAKYLKDERSITYDQAVEALFLSSSQFFNLEAPLDYANRETILQKDFNAEALNGETEAVAALAVASFMEGACEIMSAYEEGEGGASTTKKDAAYLAMAKQMASFTSSLNLSACLEEVASDNIGEDIVVSRRSKTNTLLSNFKTDVFAVMDEQDKAPNYLVTKLNVLNRSGKKFAETEVVNIKAAGGEEDLSLINVTVSTKFNAEKDSIAQIEEGVANKTVAEAAASFTPHQLTVLSFGPNATVGAFNNPDAYTGTFHTVDDEIGVGTMLLANTNVDAELGATATNVTATWGQSEEHVQTQLKLGNVAANNMDHYHSNAYGILGDGLTTQAELVEGKLITTRTANKFYKIESKGSASNANWRVTEVYEGNPRLESESFTAEQKAMYMPVTQSYEFPPMDITIKKGGADESIPAYKIITQEAVEGEEGEGEGIPEQSFLLDDIKFMYTGSTGAHMISGSRNIATNPGHTVTIQSNSHPSVKLRWINGGLRYDLMHNQRILFSANTGISYNALFSNFANQPHAEEQSGRQWILSAGADQVDPSGTGGRVASTGEIFLTMLIFSGSNLAEGIS